jgi:hypothetical protein
MVERRRFGDLIAHPVLLLMILLQRWFVKRLVETEK